MVANKKSLFLLKISDGEGGFKTIAGLEISSFALNKQIVGSSNLESGNWRELSNGGIKSLSISASGIFKNSEYEEQARSIAFAGNAESFQLLLANGDVIEANCIIGSYSKQGSVDREEIYSISLESSGTVTYTPAS